MPDNKPLLELKGICKSFGSFMANDHIDLKIHPGEVHAVLGENGAGKSTLMNIIYGMYRQDEGTVELEGVPVDIRSPRKALALGIGMVHQHFMLVDVFSSAENVFLIGDSPWWKRNKAREIEKEIGELAAQYGIEVDAHTQVDKLSIGMQQRVEILKLLYRGAKLLILDEPTTVLPPQECEILFETVRKLVAAGKSIVFISHKLDEVLAISDRITVLSQGHVEGEMLAAEADKEKIIRMMVGGDVTVPERQAAAASDTEVIRVEDVKALDDRGVSTLNGVTFSVKKGEIVGVASMEGNGQSELAEVLTGVRCAESGTVWINGESAGTHSARAFIKNDIGYVPADRNEVGSVKDFPLYENWSLRTKCSPKKHGLLDYRKIKSQTCDMIEDFDVRTTGIDARTGNLSGGNLQKFILGRELNKQPQALVCSYPTRGLDIKASWFIREQIAQAAQNGIAVVFFSGDFEELFYLADRLIVLYRGRIVGEVKPEEFSVNEIGRMMMGVKGA